ncbi:unnamed protein product [Caenorhabditis bovis]|uniref:protein-tyrosine-phosphatase n=1 Tax=Caenorhabditis bovis TaxID=2654633 RepID=A0A8S1EXN7_9PELO|nr:unnamed protein product [Caenorhabditis bovis]
MADDIDWQEFNEIAIINTPVTYYNYFIKTLHFCDVGTRWSNALTFFQTAVAEELAKGFVTYDIARLPHNLIRNRYLDVLPYDDTRVEITVTEDNPQGYINANYVYLPEAMRRYILCQGPLDVTNADFYDMVVGQKVKSIIMLNKVIEGGKNKCAKYFPTSEEPTHQFGQFKITLKSELYVNESICHRVLKIETTSNNEVHEVNHLLYTEWPDFGVPTSPTCFLQMLQYARQSGLLPNNVDEPPTVVHCSAGIGRSGTFVFVDSIIRMAELGFELSYTFAQHVLNMRRYRFGLIQTPFQLKFAVIAVLRALIEIVHVDVEHAKVVMRRTLEEERRRDEENRNRFLALLPEPDPHILDDEYYEEDEDEPGPVPRSQDPKQEEEEEEESQQDQSQKVEEAKPEPEGNSAILQEAPQPGTSELACDDQPKEKLEGGKELEEGAGKKTVKRRASSPSDDAQADEKEGESDSDSLSKRRAMIAEMVRKSRAAENRASYGTVWKVTAAVSVVAVAIVSAYFARYAKS